MKIENLFKITVATIGLSVLFTACQNSSDAVNSQAIATADVQIEAEANNITDDVLVMVDETYAQQEFANKSEMNHLNRWMPDCATVTEVVTNTTKDVTIDFGSACVLKNGNTVSGKILMHYVSDPIALTRTINVTFDNFYNNQRKIEGQHTILRERSNSNGNPQATNTESITITWPDGTVASKNGTRIHELIAGADTMAWGDDVLSITGNWTFTRKNGSVHTTTITTALRKELACRFIVSGIVSLENNGQTAVLNYGDGSCDDLATLTKNGVDEIIHLRK